jgi:ankyrin repeat protein
MWPQEDIDSLVDNIIKNLYNDPRLSDLNIRLKDGTKLNAHKIVLAARSKIWYGQFLSSASSSSSPTTQATISTPTKTTEPSFTVENNHVSTQSNVQQSQTQTELDWSDVDTDVATTLLTWVYTNQFEYDSLFQDEQFIFGCMKVARRFKLTPLINQCEKCLLAMAPEVGLDKIARLLLEGQANMNTTNEEGYTLLHLAIMNGDEKGAIYLLKNAADINMRTPTNQTPLELAIRHKLPQVVRMICQKDYDLKNVKCSNGDPPLWLALTNRDENIASILVEYNCDTNCWEEVPTKYVQNLLHRALDQNDEQTACFLIRSGCDCNSPRRPLEDGQGDEEAFDNQTPLHIACAWNMQNVVQTLLEHHADINSQDSEGRTPLHVAIINQHEAITNLLVSQQELDLKLRDKYGQNAFATAMSTKNNKAAMTILGREPHAAEKYDPKGRTFLHLAILKNDIESVLFLLSVHVNIHSRVQDSSKLTPLHLAVQVGSELIVRNLLLAGANINDVTVQNQSALHIAASHDHHQICQILLENNINYECVDTDLNNALHLACQNGNLNSCKVLLTESQISAAALNLRGQNPVHLLAQHGKENASAILEIFMKCMPEYPINTQDGEGNTALLLAYKNGNANLCRSLIRYGACLGSTNKSGLNIFNVQVASKNLLYRLLDFLPQEPPWADGDSCLECQSAFKITNRKHHCRHCGRILCAKCSPREMVITKFKSPKPVRVCNICAEVLAYGETTSG